MANVMANSVLSGATLKSQTDDATATAGVIRKGYTAYAKGEKIEGTMPMQSDEVINAVTVEVDAATGNLKVLVPEGYYYRGENFLVISKEQLSKLGYIDKRKAKVSLKTDRNTVSLYYDRYNSYQEYRNYPVGAEIDIRKSGSFIGCLVVGDIK